jgi:hypothetical protein
MKVKIVGCFALVALWLPSAAQGNIAPRYFPSHPYTDDTTITIKWQADKDLKHHYIYESTIHIISQNHYECINNAQGHTEGRVPTRGHTVKIELDSFTHEWCNGRVLLTIGYTKSPEKEECSQTINEFAEEEPPWCPEIEFPFHPIFEGEFRIFAKP